MKTLNLNVLAHYGLVAIIATMTVYGIDVCMTGFPTFAGYLGAAIPGLFAVLSFLLGRFTAGE